MYVKCKIPCCLVQKNYPLLHRNQTVDLNKGNLPDLPSAAIYHQKKLNFKPLVPYSFQ